MTIDGTITHGMAVDIESTGGADVVVELRGGARLCLCRSSVHDIVLAMGPIGAWVDLSGYATKEELQQKQDRLTAGKDIYINNNTIDNEHDYFSNPEIDELWDLVMNA